MIRVLIDGRIGAHDGIGRYTTCLIRALHAGGGPDVRLTVLAPTGTPRYSLAEGAELVRAATDADADVIHALDFRIPAEPVPVPVVATVHDVLRLDHRHCYTNEQFARRFGGDGLALLQDAVRHLRESPRPPGPLVPPTASLHAEFYSRMLALTCLQARRVVTPTATVATELARQVPLATQPVPVPLGIDHMTAGTIGGSAKSVSVTPPGYLLYVGQARMHKGLPELIAAYQCSHAHASGIPLVCAGRDFEPGTDATAQIEAALGRDAITVGEVPDSILRDLYGQAAALIHLATHEGFGLTPLEAMACGTRVIASDIPVLRETLGQHAELVDPGSARNAAKGIDKILTEPDDSQARHARMRWASGYTWHRHAQSILRLYQQCPLG